MTVETTTTIPASCPESVTTWTRKRGRKPIVLRDNRINPLDTRAMTKARQRRHAAVSQHHTLLSSAITVGVFDHLSVEWDAEMRRFGRRAIGITTSPGDTVRRARAGMHTLLGQISDFDRADFPRINRFVYHNHAPDLLSEEMDGGQYDGLTPEGHRAITMISRGAEMETYAYASPEMARLAQPIFWLRNAATAPAPECSKVETELGLLPAIAPIPRAILDAHASAEKVWKAGAALLSEYGYHCRVVRRWTPTAGQRVVLVARASEGRGPLRVSEANTCFDIAEFNEAMSR